MPSRDTHHAPFHGGYDDGYADTDLFWGTEPSSLVRHIPALREIGPDYHVLDAGAGEGKNSAYLASLGASVTAVELSRHAADNARRVIASHDSRIRWVQTDIRDFDMPDSHYDCVVAYGLTHCLETSSSIEQLLDRLVDSIKKGGLLAFCAFNDRRHDNFAAAHGQFEPTLLSHREYVSYLSDAMRILVSSDEDLTETHPDKDVEHTHSMTRILAER